MPVPTPSSAAPVPSPDPSLGAGSFRARIPTVLLLVLFSLAFGGLQIVSGLRRAATYDEPIHLTAGYVSLAKGDHRVDPTHPPLLRMWCALPLLAMDLTDVDTSKIDTAKKHTWNHRAYGYANNFLYGKNDATPLLNTARGMSVLLGAALGILLFFWARTWLGPVPAMLSLVFFLLSPNLGAHSSLVTTDIGVTLFFFGTVFFLWRTCRRWAWTDVFATAACFALANVSKYSAVLLAPTVVVLLAYSTWRGGVSWRRAVGLLAFLATTTVATIWAVYSFRYAPSASPDWLFQTRDVAIVREQLPMLSVVLNWIDLYQLLPNAYAQGFLLSNASADVLPGYLGGEISKTGWWYYFPVAFLVKTPAVLLLLFVAGLGIMARRWTRLGIDNMVFLLVPPLVYLGFAIASPINIGLRHILPVYPFVLLIAATVVWAIGTTAWRPRTQAITLGSGMALWMVLYSHAYPNTLSFFNFFVGGARHGIRYLADSNLDWGQHLTGLKDWMDENKVEHINLVYFGSASPSYYRINCTHLLGATAHVAPVIAKPKLPGYVAISETLQCGVYLPPELRLLYRGFKNLPPVAIIGNTIRVYHIERWPETPYAGDTVLTDEEIAQRARLGDELAGLKWHRRAIFFYSRYLLRRPDDPRVLTKLGASQFALGQKKAAARSLAQAVAADPESPALRAQAASMLLEHELVSEALGHALACARMLPRNAEAQDLAGVALARTGRIDEAAKAFARAVALAPGVTDFRDHLEQAERLLRTTGKR